MTTLNGDKDGSGGQNKRVINDHPILGASSHLSSSEGLEAFCRARRSCKPSLPTRAAWRTMAPRERAAFDQLRMEHHQNFGPIFTTELRRIRAALRAQFMANLGIRLPGIRRGGIIDGHGGLGKTTILTEFGRGVWRVLRLKHGDTTADGDDFLPVVYISLPGGTTIKGFNRQVLDFYGKTSRRGATVTELTIDVKKFARRCGTVLFLIDDIHFLPMRSDDGQTVNDHFKHLATETSATFVYAGIGCEDGGFLNEGGRHSKAVSQTSSRFTLYPVYPFSRETDDGKREWLSLLAAAESEMALFEARPGMLTSLERYIFERTGGEIGETIALIRAGAHRAILKGEERIVEALLDEIPLSYQADTRYTKLRGQKVRPAAEDTKPFDKAILRFVRSRTGVPSGRRGRGPAGESEGNGTSGL